MLSPFALAASVLDSMARFPIAAIVGALLASVIVGTVGGDPASVVKPVSKPMLHMGTVNVDSLNIRKAPGAVWPIVGKLTKGTSVTITGEIVVTGDKWYGIQAGFVAARYVDLRG